MRKLYTMRQIWDIIERWLAANTPWIYDSLAPPATEEELNAAESALGVVLPPDVRESYRIHNGQKPFRWDSDQKGTGFVYGDPLQTLEWIVDICQQNRDYPYMPDVPSLEVVGPVKGKPDNPLWIPLTLGPANYAYYLDLDPAPGGDVGQVVIYIYDEVKAVRVNRSFKERLLHLAVRLSLDMYVYSESMGSLVTVKDRADELAAYGLKTPEEKAEYDRLREIQRQTTLYKVDPQ